MSETIIVQVVGGEGRLLIATSDQIQGLRVVAVSLPELMEEVPACINAIHEAAHGTNREPFDVEYQFGAGQ